MATPKIRSANAASTSSIAPTLPRTLTISKEEYSISLHKASQLPESVKDRIYDLFHQNMAPLSKESSLEYTELSKREELFDETGRFLLLRRGSGVDGHAGVDMPGALPGKESQGKDEGEVLGYVSFRFDTEETLGSRDAEVVYCYELQLDPSIRRLGLAKVLMDELERIGKSRKLDKVMLTCLKGNTAALSFYSKQGYVKLERQGADSRYEPDEIDPTRMEEDPDSDQEDDDDEADKERAGELDEDEGWEEVSREEGMVIDYVILSKALRRPAFG